MSLSLPSSEIGNTSELPLLRLNYINPPLPQFLTFAEIINSSFDNIIMKGLEQFRVGHLNSARGHYVKLKFETTILNFLILFFFSLL
jgi:hypothetical protein